MVSEPSSKLEEQSSSTAEWSKSPINPAAMANNQAGVKDEGESLPPALNEKTGPEDCQEKQSSTEDQLANMTSNLSLSEKQAEASREGNEMEEATRSLTPPPSAQQAKDDSLPLSPPPPAPPPKDVKPQRSNGVSSGQMRFPTSAKIASATLHPGHSTGHHHNRTLSSSSFLDSHEDTSGDEKGEIHNIMSQFSPSTTPVDGQNEESVEERREATSPKSPSFGSRPPRTSSLENVTLPKRESSLSLVPPSPNLNVSSKHPEVPPTPTTAPPAPDPEPPLPFDFHRFLEQLKHRTADPVAKYLKSFLGEFSKRQWQVHEQVKIISDFLNFIHNKMAQCEVWRDVSDDEFDNAREGMEKLVMNRLYQQTFSPEIAPPPPLPPGRRGKRRDHHMVAHPGRRGQHQEDVERDQVLAQKVAIYGWVREEHLDIQPVGDSGRKFLSLAVQELLKIKSYRAPRDKVICVLNCCKVIFGLLRHAKTTQSADDFVPLLIYVVLRANPEHLVSNVQYILRFRNPDKLGGEAGYYLSSLSGAIQFIESLDKNSLTCSDEEFERNVEEAVKKIAERREPISPVLTVENRARNGSEAATSASASAEATPRRSAEIEERKSSDSRRDAPVNNNNGTGEEERAVVTGFLQTIKQPLSTIGRIFIDDSSSSSQQQQISPTEQRLLAGSGPAVTPLPGNTPRGSPSPNSDAPAHRRSSDVPGARHLRDQAAAEAMSAEESAARQASAELAEAAKLERAEHENVVNILSSMFPALDKDIIDDVVRLKQGRVGLAVDACLALSSG